MAPQNVADAVTCLMLSVNSELQSEVKALKEYIEDVFTDYNDINEDTRIQLELINESLAELQAQKKLSDKPRNPVGFVKPKKE